MLAYFRFAVFEEDTSAEARIAIVSTSPPARATRVDPHDGPGEVRVIGRAGEIRTRDPQTPSLVR